MMMACASHAHKMNASLYGFPDVGSDWKMGLGDQPITQQTSSGGWSRVALIKPPGWGPRNLQLMIWDNK